MTLPAPVLLPDTPPAATLPVGGTPAFSSRLVAWQRQFGRHDLPWQGADAYRVWLSEIMLQQTQVSTVEPYFQRFTQRWPTVQALAAASVEEVLGEWSGLGYYRRARLLHQAAQRMAAQGVPSTVEAWLDLPGVGPSTAAAITVFACGGRAAILDGNVKRVLARHAGVEGPPNTAAVEKKLWALAQQRLPPAAAESAALVAYTQGLMDLGATLCTPRQARCGHCPVAADCVAHLTDRVALLPTPKPRRQVPTLHWHLLLQQRQHPQAGLQVWLQRRPEQGIWAQMWSLPQRDQPWPELWPELDARCWSAPGRAIKHQLTHYTLQLHVWQWQGAPVLTEALAPGFWVEVEALARAPLPKPIRQILLASLNE